MWTTQSLKRAGFDRSFKQDGELRVRCSQCNALVIMGTPCHETGCRNVPQPQRATRRHIHRFNATPY
jgi:hypothetical protein